MRKTILLLFTVLLVASIGAQNTAKENIFEVLSKKDSVSGAVVKVHQNKNVEQRVARGTSQSGNIQSVTTTGYRVQVFSSNTQRTARGEAYKVEKEIREAFPEQEVYVSYTSPFWRVRIGNFRTIDEAQEFRAEVIKEFPNLRTDTYTVRDQIQL